MSVIVIMMVVVTVPMIVMMMVVIVAIAFKELRLDVEDTIEIEGVTAQNLVKRDFGPLGLVHFGIRINGANARLDLAEFARARRDRSC